MAAVATCKQIPYMVKGDKGYLSISFDSVLAENVTLTGSPTVAEQTTSALTVGTPSIYSGLALTTLKWNETYKTLTKVGAFAGYEYNTGDTINITGGTNATTGTYVVTGKANDNQIVLETSLGENASVADIAGTLAASKKILGEAVKPNRSIDVYVDSSAATAGTTYRLRATVTTTENSSTGVRIRDVLLKVIAQGTD